MATKADVMAIIDEMIANKTLSLDALKGVDALKTKVTEYEDQIKKLKENVESYKTAAGAAELKNSIINAENAAFKAKEEALIKREFQIHQNEMAAAVARAEAAAYRHSMETVFRVPKVRETAYGSMPVAMPQSGGYTSSGTTSTNTEKTYE